MKKRTIIHIYCFIKFLISLIKVKIKFKTKYYIIGQNIQNKIANTLFYKNCIIIDDHLIWYVAIIFINPMSESATIEAAQNQAKDIFKNSNNTVINEEILFTNTTNNSNMSQMINNGIQLPFNPVLLAIGIIIMILVIVKLCKGKKHNRNKILLIGQRNAGKTQLFISLNEGASFPTVPSIKNNKVGFLLNGKQLQFWDYCGDDLSKQQCLSFLNQNQLHTIIHVVDGCDSKKITPAALFLYRVLISKAFQRSPCNYILFFNKSDDDKNYMGLVKLTKKLEDQIEHIKQARKNEQQTENQTQEDYLKMNRSRFDIKKSEVRIVEGSAKDNIKQLRLVLQQ